MTTDVDNQELSDTSTEASDFDIDDIMADESELGADSEAPDAEDPESAEDPDAEIEPEAGRDGADQDPLQALTARLDAAEKRAETAEKATREIQESLTGKQDDEQPPQSAAEANQQYRQQLRDSVKEAGFAIDDEKLYSAERLQRTISRAMFGGNDPEQVVAAVGDLMSEVKQLKSQLGAYENQGVVSNATAELKVEYGEDWKHVQEHGKAVVEEFKASGMPFDASNRAAYTMLVKRAIDKGRLAEYEASKAAVASSDAKKRQIQSKVEGAAPSQQARTENDPSDDPIMDFIESY